jgi:hydroxymethylpyrimidine/phosphomethylpyrimidine kinase
MSAAVALTIAGSDSSGGAGIAADLKTFAALGVYGACAVTALTAQNTTGIVAIHEVPPAFVTAQIEAVFSDLDVGAVKIGMLANAAVIEAVAAALARRRARNVVLDPVLAATSGEQLLAPEATARLREVMAGARGVTPNLREAAILLDAPVARDARQMQAQAQGLLGLGAQAVLLKGGHLDGEESVDVLVDAHGSERFAAPRIATRNTHGTGCTLSSAIAAGLAKGFSLREAARGAKLYVSAAIAAADRLSIGSDGGPLHHFYTWW